jgi:flagellar operon protein
MSLVQSVRTAAAQALQARPKATAGSPGVDAGEFARMLRTRLDEQHIAVSAHAADRMIRRGLIPDENTINQLQTAFDLAAQKGSREALFLLDDLAVIASVPSRTVKTALDRESLEAGVFTNIDAAIVLSPKTRANDNSNQQDNLSSRSIGRTPNGEAAIQPGGLPL